MTIMQTVEAGSIDAVSALIAGLEREFGRGAGRALADRFMAAEDTDFCWDARIAERYLGSFDSLDDEDMELDRVAIMGRLGGVWFASICTVDGEGQAQGMICRRVFESRKTARKAWANAR